MNTCKYNICGLVSNIAIVEKTSLFNLLNACATRTIIPPVFHLMHIEK